MMATCPGLCYLWDKTSSCWELVFWEEVGLLVRLSGGEVAGPGGSQGYGHGLPQTQDDTIQEISNSQFRLVLSVMLCMPCTTSLESAYHCPSPLLLSPIPTSSLVGL